MEFRRFGCIYFTVTKQCYNSWMTEYPAWHATDRIGQLEARERRGGERASGQASPTPCHTSALLALPKRLAHVPMYPPPHLKRLLQAPTLTDKRTQMQAQAFYDGSSLYGLLSCPPAILLDPFDNKIHSRSHRPFWAHAIQSEESLYCGASVKDTILVIQFYRIRYTPASNSERHQLCLLLKSSISNSTGRLIFSDWNTTLVLTKRNAA